MAITSTTIANQAIQLIGDNQEPVTGVAPTFDNSTAGVALQAWYQPVVRTVAKQYGWDFTRNTVALSLSGNAAPFPWSVEYIYPGNGVEVWYLVPPSSTDLNNPLPVNWQVANTQVSGTQTKVIQANLASALAIYNNVPTEGTWDALFQEAVVRLLSSVLAAAIAGKPDMAAAYLESGAAFETIGESRMG